MHYIELFVSFVNELAVFLIVIIVILGKTNLAETIKAFLMMVPEHKLKLTECKKAEQELEKTRAEIEKTKAETKRITAETIQILADTELKLNEATESKRFSE